MNLIEFQLLKSRSGVYKDTPENRRLHRVGQRYGVQKVDEVVEIKNYFSQKVIPNVNSFQKASYGFANKFGIRVTSVSLKSVESVKRKILLEGTSVSKLKDLIRNTFIVEASKLDEILFELKGEFKVVRHKVQTPENFAGYSGHILNIEFGDGLVGEIQVNTPQMIFGKEKPEISKTLLGEELFEKCRKSGVAPGRGHEIYERIRVLPKTSGEAVVLIKESEKYYNEVRNIKL